MGDLAVAGEALEKLKAIVGPGGYLDEETGKAPYVTDFRGIYRGDSPLVLRPASTHEVARIVAVCHEERIGVVPQGGNTGMVGGGVPRASAGEIVVSLARMNRVRDLDAVDYTMTVEAGCVLAEVQRAAEEAGRYFPLSLAAEGSCQIGGNLSTNAGGTAVLRYGNARDLVLGLEVVLPSGEIWDGLRRLRKNNTGYDMKQIFLGAEGSLGIVTAAVLKLFPRPVDTATALVALPGAAAAPPLLGELREASGDEVTTFEYIHRGCLDLLFEHGEGHVDPFGDRHEHYALVELASSRRDAELGALLERVLASAFEAGDALDAVIASSGAQREQLWRMREEIPEAQKRAGANVKHDVAVPVSRVPEFLERATRLCEESAGGVRIIAFGHIGDGNIHFNLSPPKDGDAESFLERAHGLVPRVHDLAVELDGSFSAEHGIGQLKRGELERYKAPVELELMRVLKRALDPRGIMNPGKVIEDH